MASASMSKFGSLTWRTDGVPGPAQDRCNGLPQCRLDWTRRITEFAPRFFERQRFGPQRDPHALECRGRRPPSNVIRDEFHRCGGHLGDPCGNWNAQSLVASDCSQDIEEPLQPDILAAENVAMPAPPAFHHEK